MCAPSGSRSDALPEADGRNMEKLMCTQKNQCPNSNSFKGLVAFYSGSDAC